MAYLGYLIKVGNYTIPFKYMKADSYSAYRSVQDLDSYRDANGILHRTALTHVPNKVEFETPAMLTDKSFSELMKNIQNNYLNSNERKLLVSMYIPEIDGYVEQEMYMPDITPKIFKANSKEVKYSPIRLAFIGY